MVYFVTSNQDAATCPMSQEEDPDRSLDRMALICRIMMDQRVIELRRQNEELRLALFVEQHTTVRLRSLLKSANRSAAGPNCRCVICQFTGRHEIDGGMTQVCTFIPWLNALVAEYGLIAAKCETLAYDAPRPDVHFCHNSKEEWTDFSFGAKFFSSKSVSDPEIVKIKQFFEHLESMCATH